MEKNHIYERLLSASKPVSQFCDNPFTWLKITQLLETNNIKLQDIDILEIGLVAGYDFGDSSRDAYWDFKITRPRLETDEEFLKRTNKLEQDKAAMYERRYQLYLELREEFGA